MSKRREGRSVPATEAAKNFGSLVDRVRESGTVYRIESRGQVVAEIGPARRRFTAGDLKRLFERGHRAPAELLDAIDAARLDTGSGPAAPVRRLSGRGGRPRAR